MRAIRRVKERAKAAAFRFQKVSSYLKVSRMLLTEGDTRQLDCLAQILPVRDALDFISGKGKMLILTSLMHGNRRFRKSKLAFPTSTPRCFLRN